MEANVKQIKEYFGLQSREMMNQWRELDTDAKQYFKIAVGELIESGDFIPSKQLIFYFLEVASDMPKKKKQTSARLPDYPIVCQQCLSHTNKPSYCGLRGEYVARKQVVSMSKDLPLVCLDFEWNGLVISK